MIEEEAVLGPGFLTMTRTTWRAFSQVPAPYEFVGTLAAIAQPGKGGLDEARGHAL